jgi:hypothetical protein
VVRDGHPAQRREGPGDYWQVVSAAGWENKFWKQSIVPMRGDGSFASAIATNSVLVTKPVTLGEFHAKLRDLAEKPLRKNLMFPGLADRYNQNRRKAQRIVFEAGVVRPLIEATRQKMLRDDGDRESAQRQPDALAGLIQVEADILSRGTGTNTGELTPEGARRFLGAFQNYVAGRDVPVDTNLVAVMAWTYSTNETLKGSWAPRWFSGGRGATNTLAANAGINAGLELFVRSATNSIQAHLADWNQISSLRTSVKTFATRSALFAAARGSTRLEAQRAVPRATLTITGERDDPAAVCRQFIVDERATGFRAAVTTRAVRARSCRRQLAALAANQDYLSSRTSKPPQHSSGLGDNRITQLLEAAT